MVETQHQQIAYHATENDSGENLNTRRTFEQVTSLAITLYRRCSKFHHIYGMIALRFNHPIIGAV